MKVIGALSQDCFGVIVSKGGARLEWEEEELGDEVTGTTRVKISYKIWFPSGGGEMEE